MSETNSIKKMLKSENIDQLTTALYVLMHYPKKTNFINELYICAKNSNVNVRLPAIMVLSKIHKKKIIPILEESLKDEVEKIRIIAAISLANFKNRKAIPILTRTIQNDINDHSLHKRAIEALGKFKDESLLNVFEQLIHHRRKISRIKAVDALTQIGNEDAYKILENALSEEKDDKIKVVIQNVLRNFKLS